MKMITRPTLTTPEPDRPQQRRVVPPFVLSSLGILLVVVMLASVSFGSISVPVLTIVQILLNSTRLFHFPVLWDPALEIIIMQVRLPVVVGAALVGAALAVAGTLFQGMLRNPLADPYLMGTSSGAAMGATIAFVLPFDTVYGSFFPLTPLLAFCGAVVTVIFVYALARSDGRTPVIMLLLAGVVVNAVLTAFQTLILNLWPSNDFGRILGLYNWLSGGIAIVGWGPLAVVAVIVLLGLLVAFALARVLDVFALGEDAAAHLGLHVEWMRFLIVVVASLLTAAAVSISGLIGFVGLVTPHFMRLLLGPRHRVLMPAAALGGAIFLTLADLLARVVLPPTVIPVGVFTALVGAPFFLFLLRSSKREYKW
ncbi:FecCD family ABC transporter permease [Dictyobacter formicarum]|uniref:Corrinoid ABC transporter permease n=1 Tax=Dictyobacter formicarum TaxID=2778368 RepID=A0ABQ3VU91_9CHLR|nr:iron ABC transporter permease [Dictyobacter formicarum]GHO89370.1 corrinoid ABC transporter permease [Dictyobacter formicarum]